MVENCDKDSINLITKSYINNKSGITLPATSYYYYTLLNKDLWMINQLSTVGKQRPFTVNGCTCVLLSSNVY